MLWGAAATLEHCHIHSNSAGSGGGMVVWPGGTTTVMRSNTFTNNGALGTCELSGGGTTGTSEMFNNTFAPSSSCRGYMLSTSTPFRCNRPGRWMLKAPFAMTATNFTGCLYPVYTRASNCAPCYSHHEVQTPAIVEGAVRSILLLVQCAPGFYGTSYTSTSSECTAPCTRGHYCPVGSVTPIPCPRSSYMPDVGADKCIACPTFATTFGTGATSIDACRCSVPLALTPVRGGGYRCDQHRRMPVLGEFLLRFRSCCVQAMPQPVDEQSRLDKC